MFDVGMLQGKEKEKMKLEKVKQEVLNENFALYDLDNTMQQLGYFPIAIDGWDNCTKDGNLVYTETNYFSSVELFFETVIPGEEEFMSEYTEIKITKVEEF